MCSCKKNGIGRYQKRRSDGIPQFYGKQEEKKEENIAEKLSKVKRIENTGCDDKERFVGILY